MTPPPGQQYEKIQEILLKTHTAQELAVIMVERTQWSIESHAAGAYGTAREQALMASLARQLIGAREELEEHSSGPSSKG